MSNQAPVRLLILDNSQNRAEELIVLLRNSGRATRAQQVESHENLQSLLKAQSWDLFLARPEANDVTAEQAIALIKEFERDIPLILLADDDRVESITEGLQLGATDVALADDDERLILLIDRELNNLEARRNWRKAEISLKESERRCQLLLENSRAAISYIHDGMHIFANEPYLEVFGFKEFDDVEVVPIIDLVESGDQARFKKFLKSFEKLEEASEEYQCVTDQGETIQIQMVLSKAQYDGEPCTQVIAQSVVSDQELENRLKEMSSQDELTGLFNRRHFMELLDGAIEQAVTDNEFSTVLYMAVDGFSDIVTEAGISNADVLIADISGHIKSLLDESQLLARFSDDVFTLLYPDGSKKKALEFAEKIRSSVAEHLFEADGKTHQITISIGLSLVTESSTTSEEIISRSQRASMEAKSSDKVIFYQKEKAADKSAKESASDIDLKELILTSFDDGRLKLLFQPIISLHGDDDGQFEVLVRLHDTEGNELRPNQFLDLVDQEGLSIKLDRWIILQSIKLLSAHRGEGNQTRLFINVTHRTLADETFLPWVSVALKAARLPTDAVIFQFHESDAITYMKQASKFTKGLKELHCKASINHFGCSLDPFNSLKHLHVDYVKIDGSYADGVESDEKKGQELIDTVSALHAKGVLTAISGVESPMVLSTLWEAGVNFIQGHYLSEPLEQMDYDFSSEDM
jgi:diguanylate cyclase (GGDEF)-like protein/PAS domain S-box-containing protein